MSARNGDKSRHHRLRKATLARRLRMKELIAKLKATEAVKAAE